MRINRVLGTFLLALVLLLAIPVSAYAAPPGVHVAVFGDDVVGDGSFANPYATVQRGINQCPEGGFVFIGPGDFTGSVTMRDGVSLTGSWGEEKTKIIGTGGPAISAITIGEGESIEQLVITGGTRVSMTGGGVYCSNSSPLIRLNTFTGNAGYIGGGVACYASAPLVQGNEFTGNTAVSGGGVGGSQGSAAVVADNTMTGNTTTDAGGGVAFYGGAPTVTNNVISANSSSRGGGMSFAYGCTATVTSNTVLENTSTNVAGGVQIYDSAVEFRGNEIAANTASTSGGGVYMWGAQASGAVVADNNIHGNSGSPGGGIYQVAASAAIRDNHISDNTGGSAGGGIYCENSASSVVRNVVMDNTGAQGGGIFLSSSSSPSIINNLIARNTATPYMGGGIIFHGGSPVIVNNTITGNSATSWMGAGVYGSGGSPTITNCIIWGNGPSDMIGANATYSAVRAGNTAGTGNTTADPKFKTGDFELTFGSPCIDTASSAAAPASDIGEVTRPQGTAPDMGAFEYYAPVLSHDAPTEWRYDDALVTLSATGEYAEVASLDWHWTKPDGSSSSGSVSTDGTSILITEEGTNTITFKATDTRDHRCATETATVRIDRTAPTSPSLSLNGGADYIGSTSAIANLSAIDTLSGVAEVQLSNDGVFDTEEWLAYAAARSWTLPAGEGEKVVYARFRDAVGNVSAVTTDSIELDYSPSLGEDFGETDEETTLTVPAPGVLGNDTDATGPVTDATVVTEPTHGQLALNLDGSYVYEPDVDFAGTDFFIYKATDGRTWSETTCTITVNNLNDAPTDISLSATSVNENVAGNTTVGTLSTTDPDVGDAFTYTLVAGTGDTDNAAFNISGAGLRITSSPDFETKSSYSVRVRTTDQGALTFEKSFTITVNDINEAPTNLALSVSWVFENNPVNGVIGSFTTTDPDSGGTFAYALVSGTGDSGNGSFTVADGVLRAAESFDYETQSSYSIRVRATDQGGLYFEKAFTISVMNANEAPTSISLSATSLAENSGANAVVGSMSTTDPDAGNTFTYTLVAGAGDTDNASFNINGGQLRATASLNYEAKSSYTVRIRTTDQGSLFYDEAFTITVTDVNEAPVLPLNIFNIAENQPAGTSAGLLTASDPDSGDTITFTIVGGADQASFEIVGNQLRTKAIFDYETKNSYSVQVRGTDSGGLFDEEFVSVQVTDVNETPVAVGDALTVDEDTPLAITWATDLLVNDVDPDGDLLAVSLQGVPGNGILNGGVLGGDYTPVPDYFGPDTFTYKAFDGELSSALATVTITVNPVNDAPTFTSGGPVTVAEDSGPYSAAWATSISAGAANEAFQVLSFETSNTNPSLFSAQPVVAADGTLSFTPAPDANGVASVTTTLTDDATAGGPALSVARTFTVTVTAVSDETTFTVTSSNAAITYGGSYTFRASLTCDGAPVAGATVQLHSSDDGVTYAATGLTATTAADGTFTISVSPNQTTFYRAVFAGSAPIYVGSTSTAVKVSTPAVLTVPKTSSRVYAGKSAVFYGFLKPRHTAGTKPVRIYRYRYVSGAWKSYGYVLATASNYSSYSKYSAALSLPYAGRWRLRAYAPQDGEHAASWSAYSYVTTGTRGDLAVAIARRSLGRSYKWGAAGPYAFDSSGLTKYVYGQLGVRLPHYSRSQSYYGRAVSRSQLKPGDLVFFYRPIHHVGIYIGGGKMIIAPKPGGVVRVESLHPAYAGARRVW